MFSASEGVTWQEHRYLKLRRSIWASCLSERRFLQAPDAGVATAGWWRWRSPSDSSWSPFGCTGCPYWSALDQRTLQSEHAPRTQQPSLPVGPTHDQVSYRLTNQLTKHSSAIHQCPRGSETGFMALRMKWEPTFAPTQPEYCSVQMTRVRLLGARSETLLGDIPKASRQSSA